MRNYDPVIVIHSQTPCQQMSSSASLLEAAAEDLSASFTALRPRAASETSWAGVSEARSRNSLIVPLCSRVVAQPEGTKCQEVHRLNRLACRGFATF